MKPFFADSRPERTATYGQATFDLPILYFRDDAFGLAELLSRSEHRELEVSHRVDQPLSVQRGK